MKTYPFYNALTHLKEFYDITMEDDEFETIGLHAWDKIGNKYTRTYHFTGRIIQGELDLPCNADIIEMVTAGGEDANTTSNMRDDDFVSSSVEGYIEGRKSGGHSLYSKGKLVEYTRAGDTLVFGKGVNGSATIIYKGVMLDDDGLPYLNFKEVDAIANYCAYVHTNKKGMTTRDAGTIQLAQLLKQEWNRVCENARTPVHLDQNDINQILNVKGSWDRKRYGKSYKLYS